MSGDMLDEVTTLDEAIGLHEDEPTDTREALDRNRMQQQQLCALAFAAAAERWPELESVWQALNNREKELLTLLEPSA